MVPLSGSGLEKGDGRLAGRFRIETKRPPTGSYRLTGADWAKIRDAALRSNEVPVFHLKLGPHSIIILREEDYLGFGGAVHGAEVCDLGRAQSGYTIDEPTWEGVRLVFQHARFPVLSGGPEEPQGVRTYTLRVMPESDFLVLVET